MPRKSVKDTTPLHVVSDEMFIDDFLNAAEQRGVPPEALAGFGFQQVKAGIRKRSAAEWTAAFEIFMAAIPE